MNAHRDPASRRGATVLALPILCCAIQAVLLGVVGVAAAIGGAVTIAFVLVGIAVLYVRVGRPRPARSGGCP